MLNEKRKKELTKAAGEAEEVVIYFRDTAKMLNADWVAFLMYLSSENLVKQSSRLSWLTVGLAITGLGMIGLAIAQLVALWK